MRVYEVWGTVKYGGGVAMVASNSQKQALELAIKEDPTWGGQYGFTSITVRCIRGLHLVTNTPRVITNHTYIE